MCIPNCEMKSRHEDLDDAADDDVKDVQDQRFSVQDQWRSIQDPGQRSIQVSSGFCIETLAFQIPSVIENCDIL